MLGDAFANSLLPGTDPTEALRVAESDLRERHRRDIHSLLRAWVRSEGILRTQLPAEQLLNWCRQIADDDLSFRCNSIVLPYEGDRIKPHEFKNQDGTTTVLVNPGAEREVESFKRFLKGFRVRILMERTDFDEAVRERWSQLSTDQVRVVSKPIPAGVEELVSSGAVPQINGERCHVVHCHYLLDIAGCVLKHCQENRRYNADLTDGCVFTLALLKQIEEILFELDTSGRFSLPGDETLGRIAEDADCWKKLKDFTIEEVADFKGDLHEAFLRLHHLRSECFLGRMIVFSHNGFSEVPEHDDSLEYLEKATAEIKAGVSRLRDQDLQTQDLPRSVTIDPVADGSLYLQYRSWFYMLSGRTRWRRSFARGDDAHASAAFEAAHNDFELARGSLGDTNPLLAAVAEFYRVEVSLARARLILNPGSSTPEAESLETARTEYETARGALQRARRALESGRRNVVWWKKFFQLASQYHSDRLLLGYTRLIGSWTQNTPPPEEIPRYLMRLSRGYSAIRSAQDYFLPGKTEPNCYSAVRSRWLLRAWWEITLSSYATGILVAKRTLDQDQAYAHRLVSDYLRWLNKSATLVPDYRGSAGSANRDFNTMLNKFDRAEPDDELLKLEPQLRLGETRLVRRHRIIGLAKELSDAASR